MTAPSRDGSVWRLCHPGDLLPPARGDLRSRRSPRERHHPPAPRALTDTHGFTEQLFGLCHLLGVSFMPRLKGPEEPPREPPRLDQLARVAASLKNRARAPGAGTAGRQSAIGPPRENAHGPRSRCEDDVHPPARPSRARSRAPATQPRGPPRTGTTPVLRRPGDVPYRRLRGNHGQGERARLLSNAVLLWNTVRLAEIVATSRPPAGESCANISRARHRSPTGT